MRRSLLFCLSLGLLPACLHHRPVNPIQAPIEVDEELMEEEEPNEALEEEGEELDEPGEREEREVRHHPKATADLPDEEFPEE